MTDDVLRRKNARLGGKINEVLQRHPEVRDVPDEIALRQGMQVRVGTSFLERVQADLQDRARAIVELRPDLAPDFRDHSTAAVSRARPLMAQIVCR